MGVNIFVTEEYSEYRLKKPNRTRVKERQRMRISGASVKTLQRIIVEKSEKIKRGREGKDQY